MVKSESGFAEQSVAALPFFGSQRPFEYVPMLDAALHDAPLARAAGARTAAIRNEKTGLHGCRQYRFALFDDIAISARFQ
jgi:hypothetical protein